MKYEITHNDWTQISTAGKNISLFIDEQDDGSKGRVDVRVIDSILKPALSEITNAKRVYKPIGNGDVLHLSPVPEDKMFWAICANEGDEATLQVYESGYGINNTMDTRAQDAKNLKVSSHITASISYSTLAADAVVNTSTVTLAAGHGFVNGTDGQIFIIPGYFLAEVTGVSGNVISLDIPLTYSFPSGTVTERGYEYLNVDGSVTPVMYGFRPEVNRKFDIYGIKITFLSTVNLAMDDSLFVNIAELTKGFMSRIKISDTQYNHVFNIKKNQDFKLYGTLEYSTKAPAGKYGMDYTVEFLKLFGAIVRLDGAKGQQLEIWVRDALSAIGTVAAGASIEASVLGHVVEE